MEQKDLSQKLLVLIHEVSQAETEREAAVSLLSPLLALFDMDQGTLCELRQNAMIPILSLDRTKKILQDPWLSRTLIEQALNGMEPIVHRSHLSGKDIPVSVNEHSLRNVVCIPISKERRTALFLASQRNPLREYAESELFQFKIAANAACLALEQNIKFRELSEKTATLQKALQSNEEGCLFQSTHMARLMEEVGRLAPFNIAIVLNGESGVGKEVIAKEIHRLSGRTGPFVAINCANLTETLLESELFGYTKGAFTGAIQSKKGLLQEAEGGTFFFDEIAELPINLQAKLLRVLQERVIRPVGATKDVPIDIRVISASHSNLKEAVEKGKFREDLYYRIHEMEFFIPPLRDRKDDLELLANHFINRFVVEFKLGKRSLSEAALRKLKNFDWPGNIRELKSVCRTAVILSPTESISEENIRISSTKKVEISTSPSLPANVHSLSLREMSQNFEYNLVKKLLDEPGENQSTVADKLNVSVRTLQRILNREGFEAQN